MKIPRDISCDWAVFDFLFSTSPLSFGRPSFFSLCYFFSRFFILSLLLPVPLSREPRIRERLGRLLGGGCRNIFRSGRSLVLRRISYAICGV